MDMDVVAASAQEHLRITAVDGWLLYDYRGMNPIFWDTVGAIDNVTRPCWLWIPAEGDLELLVSYVDQGRFGHLGIPTKLFVSRADMLARLGEMLGGANRVAMEYSPDATLKPLQIRIRPSDAPVTPFSYSIEFDSSKLGVSGSLS